MDAVFGKGSGGHKEDDLRTNLGANEGRWDMDEVGDAYPLL